MKDKWEVIIAGVGGQGILLAGQILAEAFIMETDGFVAQNQNHSTRVRGGKSQTSLILSQEEILFPMVTEADLLVALTEEAYLEYEPQVADSGLIVYDSSEIKNLHNRVTEKGYPFFNKALELENSKGITIMAFGTANEILKIVSPQYFYQAMSLHFKNDVLDLNKKAFDKGAGLVNEG